MKDEKQEMLEAVEAEREKIGLWLGKFLSEASAQRYDHLAELRAQAAALAERFREAGEDQIAEQILRCTRRKPAKGRQQEWHELHYSILIVAVFLLMWKEPQLSVRGACNRLADYSIDRDWFQVFDLVVAANHRPTAHALYEQLRFWLGKHGSSISELNELKEANGGTLPDRDLPPHLMQMVSRAVEWFQWIKEQAPEIEGPRSRARRERKEQEERKARRKAAASRGALSH